MVNLRGHSLKILGSSGIVGTVHTPEDTESSANTCLDMSLCLSVSLLTLAVPRLHMPQFLLVEQASGAAISFRIRIWPEKPRSCLKRCCWDLRMDWVLSLRLR